MTRKDYEAIALALARGRPKLDSEDLAQWAECRRELMFILAKDNPRFDVEKFKAATMENLG